MLLYLSKIIFNGFIFHTPMDRGKLIILQTWPITGDAVILIAILLFFVFLSLALTLLGLGIFCVIWVQQQRKLLVIPTLTMPSNLPQQQKVASQEVAPQEVASFDHEYLLVPFQRALDKRTPDTKSQKKPRSITYIERKIQGVMKKWQKKGQLENLIAQASEILIKELDAWNMLVQALQVLPLTLSPDQVSDYKQQALKAIHDIQSITDPVIVEDYCIKALILYTIIQPFFKESPEQQAAIDYDMGYALVHLAKDLNQLASASLSYNSAYRFFRRKPIMPVYSHPYIQTQISLGDILVAQSMLAIAEERAIHQLRWALTFYIQASDFYRKTQNTSKQSENILSHEIDERVRKTQEMLSKI